MCAFFLQSFLLLLPLPSPLPLTPLHAHTYVLSNSYGQTLTSVGRSDRLASGALDGSVVIWSMAGNGTVAPVVTYFGLCHPYRLAAFGRSVRWCIASVLWPAGRERCLLCTIGERRSGKSACGREMVAGPTQRTTS